VNIFWRSGLRSNAAAKGISNFARCSNEKRGVYFISPDYLLWQKSVEIKPNKIRRNIPAIQVYSVTKIQFA
jgi:hypothetical protein